MLNFNRKYFWLMFVLLIIEVYIGIYLHDEIIRPYIGDMLVVILLYCFVKTFLNSTLIRALAGVLLFAYIVEISQYFHLINILGLRNCKIARLILGTSFSWMDMLMYTTGALLTFVLETTRFKRPDLKH